MFSFDGLRIGAGAAAALLGLAALWMLAAGLIGPSLPYFPADPAQAQQFADVRSRTSAAAAVGMIRGDLRADAAVAEAAPLLFAGGSSPTRSDLESARDAAERAATHSPHDARVWLLLSALEVRLASVNPKAAEALKLSYYTGPNEAALAPLRLSTAARINWDEELQALVEAEIERIVLRKPDLKPAIAAAHRDATPEARQGLEAILKRADPALLSEILAAPRPQ